jgi:hypothetical protein
MYFGTRESGLRSLKAGTSVTRDFEAAVALTGQGEGLAYVYEVFVSEESVTWESEDGGPLRAPAGVLRRLLVDPGAPPIPVPKKFARAS